MVLDTAERHTWMRGRPVKLMLPSRGVTPYGFPMIWGGKNASDRDNPQRIWLRLDRSTLAKVWARLRDGLKVRATPTGDGACANG